MGVWCGNLGVQNDPKKIKKQHIDKLPPLWTYHIKPALFLIKESLLAITGLGFSYSMQYHNPQTKQSFLYTEFVKALQLQEY